MLINPYRFAGAYDTDANAYIAAVETADGQALESGVKDSINAFVVGCKADGIWSAIKACCILAGARTLAGCLVPLVGTAPTRQGTEAGWNYNRKTGLAANGTNNYINTNRAHDADSFQNNGHIAVWVPNGIAVGRNAIGAYNPTNNSYTAIGSFTSNSQIQITGGGSQVPVISGIPTGFIGAARNSSTTMSRRYSGTSDSISRTSQAPGTENVFVFASNESGATGFNSSPITFYSIGGFLDLSLLNARVATLITTIAAAIP